MTHCCDISCKGCFLTFIPNCPLIRVRPLGRSDIVEIFGPNLAARGRVHEGLC